MPEPVTLLLGGAGKQGADYTQLADLLRKKYFGQVICFGASGSEDTFTTQSYHLRKISHVQQQLTCQVQFNWLD